MNNKYLDMCIYNIKKIIICSFILQFIFLFTIGLFSFLMIHHIETKMALAIVYSGCGLMGLVSFYILNVAISFFRKIFIIHLENILLENKNNRS